MEKIDMDPIYRTSDPEDIPWNFTLPPDALVNLVEKQIIMPCKAIDLGCGAGNYAIYLTMKGFDVTGIDISPSAIQIAEENARKRGISCRFIVADVLGDLNEVHDLFDFAYDWELLHHIFPEDRETYAKNVSMLLKPGGAYLSVCFSEQDPYFGGSGKYRKTRLGTILYFSSIHELQNLFTTFFDILELHTIEISGRPKPHRAVYALMKKR